jgi:hypothetical protein
MTANITRTGFCLMIDALFEGPVPSLTDGEGRAWVFPTRIAAEREIADLLITRLQEFLDGDRDFEDAMTIEEYVVEVAVAEDGFLLDAEGARFPCCFADSRDDSASQRRDSSSG